YRSSGTPPSSSSWIRAEGTTYASIEHSHLPPCSRRSARARPRGVLSRPLRAVEQDAGFPCRTGPRSLHCLDAVLTRRARRRRVGKKRGARPGTSSGSCPLAVVGLAGFEP